MKSTEFCYWLQGFFEINGIPADGMTKAQTEMVQKHLHLVFKHEIDPSYPNADALTKIHNPPPHTSQAVPTPQWTPDSNPLIRC